MAACVWWTVLLKDTAWKDRQPHDSLWYSLMSLNHSRTETSGKDLTRDGLLELPDTTLIRTRFPVCILKTMAKFKLQHHTASPLRGLRLKLLHHTASPLLEVKLKLQHHTASPLLGAWLLSTHDAIFWFLHKLSNLHHLTMGRKHNLSNISWKLRIQVLPTLKDLKLSHLSRSLQQFLLTTD